MHNIKIFFIQVCWGARAAKSKFGPPNLSLGGGAWLLWPFPRSAPVRVIVSVAERPVEIFDTSEAIALVKHLWVLARDSAHEKTAEYHAILGELEKRQSAISAYAFQSLMLSLLGDPVRA